MVKNPPAMQETWVQSLDWEDPLEKGVATYSSILAWRIPWTEEPGRLQSMGLPRVGHDWMTFNHSVLLWNARSIRAMKNQVKVKVAQSCPTLCDPMDCSLPGSSVQGILQARRLECVAISLSGDLLIEGLNPGLLHCRQILYHLSHQGSPRNSLKELKTHQSSQICFLYFWPCCLQRETAATAVVLK